MREQLSQNFSKGSLLDMKDTDTRNMFQKEFRRQVSKKLLLDSTTKSVSEQKQIPQNVYQKGSHSKISRQFPSTSTGSISSLEDEDEPLKYDEYYSRSRKQELSGNGRCFSISKEENLIPYNKLGDSMECERRNLRTHTKDESSRITTKRFAITKYSMEKNILSNNNKEGIFQMSGDSRNDSLSGSMSKEESLNASDEIERLIKFEKRNLGTQVKNQSSRITTKRFTITNKDSMKRNSVSQNKNEFTFQISLKKNQPVDLQLFSKSTPLHNACKLSDKNKSYNPLYKVMHFTRVCRRLTTIRDGEGCTPLQHACSTGMGIDVINCLIETNPSTCSIPDNEGRLPLHNACARLYFDPDVVIALINAYPNAVVVKDRFNYTPIQYIELCQQLQDSLPT
mmetsp:Transcript_25833/g.59466  ORF Transcript_25833/g.59466 Transcript_25833/m.59466 type:complete len:396 (-) Transcript_25833:420-1607(-)